MRDSKRVEQTTTNSNTLDLISAPRAMALSKTRICVAYRKSYNILDIESGIIIKEIAFNMSQDPIIAPIQNRTQWCIQKDASTIFLNSDFDPLYDNGIIWRDIPLAIVQSSPYVLSLTNQTIEICTFNGSQGPSVQQLRYRTSSVGKPRLWMDFRTNRIYVGTTTDLFVVEPITPTIQLKNYIGAYKYETAITLIRGLLGLNETEDKEKFRKDDGKIRGNIDRSTLKLQLIFEIEQQPDDAKDHIDSSKDEDKSEEQSFFWLQFYRVGTMYGFNLFRLSKIERAFAMFEDSISDPAEIVCLFSTLSTHSWLPKFHRNFRNFLSRHAHFSEPSDFVGSRLESGLNYLQRYLTGARRIFQNVYNNAKDTTLEVYSLMNDKLILRPVFDLLTIVETSLLKVYLIDNNGVLINALLRNESNCCLPSEVERDLLKHGRKNELILFYERQGRHREAVNGIIERDGALSETVLKYLSKLNAAHEDLIFEKVEPFVRLAMDEKNNDAIDRIIRLFTRCSSETSDLNPFKIFEFLSKFSVDIGLTFYEIISYRQEHGERTKKIHSEIVRIYCEQMKILSLKYRRLNSNNAEVNFSSMDAARLKFDELQEKLKVFLCNVNCRCDFSALEAFFEQQKKQGEPDHLFSLPLAIVYGKLNRHQDAVDTFINYGHFNDAENYCDSIYRQANSKLASELYTKLIAIYLSKVPANESKENALRPVLRILNQMPDRLDTVEILKILPNYLKMNAIKDFLEFSFKNFLSNKKSSQLEKNLLLVRLARAQAKRIEAENELFVIGVNTRCAKIGCNQPFVATQAVVRFPHNQIVHFHCRTKFESQLN